VFKHLHKHCFCFGRNCKASKLNEAPNHYK